VILMLADKRVHGVMPTHDVERLSAFYRDVLGLV
jgi:catechol 2,3-dioxygenase-like lactoylglutathione lyase family enzyme